ncbi:MAG TPA: hypothetical protein VMV94_10215 [Phycisphaerae bacterium]|nr:hypothetical protein [Phycisphaerae bacterium]
MRGSDNNDQSARLSRADMGWIAATALQPFLFFIVLTFPSPFGLGLNITNDFTGHRIWYTQVDTYFISKGYFPLWNPTFEMGSPHLSIPFGTASLYPLRWWTYLPTYFGGMMNYAAQYVQISLHTALALVGLYLINRRHLRLSGAASMLAASLFLLNQCFNNFIRFPHGIENMTWVPWMLYFALNLARGAGSGAAHLRADFLALATCVLLGWLTGYGQFSYLGAMLVAVVTIIAARSLRGILLVAGAGLAGTVLAVGAIWPATQWVLNHPLRGGRDISGINTIGVTEYKDILLHPFAVDIHYSSFTFPFFFGLVLGGLLVTWRRPTMRLSLGLALAMVLLVDISRGLDGLTFKFLYRYLPFFGAFNSPSKTLWVAFIPMACFAGLFLDTLLSHRKAALVTAFLFLGAALIMAATYSAVAPPDLVGIWRPLVTGWIAPAVSGHCYRWIVCGSTVLLVLFLLIRRPVVQAASASILCILFVILYARYNTFVSPGMEPQAAIATCDAYPSGLLAGRQAVGYMGLTGIGVTSPTIDPPISEIMTSNRLGCVSPSRAQFPASRFDWRPREAGTAIDLQLTSFGPNHCFFEVQAGGRGDLVYLAKYSPYWRCDQPSDKDPTVDELYRFHVAPGHTEFKLEFVPVSHVTTGVITLLGIFGLTAMWCYWSSHRRLAVAAAVAGVVSVAAMLVGSFTRHSMSQRDLYGINNISLAVPSRLVQP